MSVKRIMSGLGLCAAVALGLAPAAQAGLFDSWAKSCTITFSGYTGSSTLTNFPALVALNTGISGFSYSDIKTNGADLRFEDSLGAELPYEIDTWNASGTSYIWVKVPTLVSSTTFIKAYWKNTSATAPSYSNQTWDANHSAVYHFAENVTDNVNAIGAYMDATANARHADQNYTYKFAAGAIGRAVYSPDTDAGGGNQRKVTIPGSILTTNTWSKELWFRRDNSGVVFAMFYGTPSGSSFIGVAAGGVPGAVVAGNLDGGMTVGDTVAMLENTWHHIFATYDETVAGGTLKLYRNGVEVASNTGVPPPIASTSFALMNTGTGFGAAPSEIDEVRASIIARSSDWVMASYKTQASNSLFQTYVMSTNQAGSVLIDSGTAWMYHSEGTLPAANWYDDAYVDSAWSNGLTPIGFNDAEIATTVSYGTNPSSKYITYYFRKHFSITNLASVTGMVAEYKADDGAVFYLNGTKIHTTANILEPVGNSSLTASSATEPYTWIPFTISPSLLVLGDNVLAVEVHQSAPDSSDSYFNMSLAAVAYATTNEMGGGISYPSDWTAYNDTAWHQDPTMFGGPGVEQAPVNYTTNSPWNQVGGALVSSNGQVLQATLSFSGITPLMLSRDFALPGTGTDLDNVFGGGKIGTNNASSWGEGTVTMTLANLNTGKQYSVAIWSSRGGTTTAYSNRWTDIVISSVDSFVNNSSVGLVQSTASMANDSTRVVAVIEGGKLARYNQIRPGSDGTILFALTANGLNSGDTNGYINAVMVKEEPISGGGSGDADVDGMDDAWETTNFGSTSAINGGTLEDYDGDGSINYDEYIAGTDPTSPSSKLEFKAASTNAPGTMVISWAGVAGKTYSIQGANTLTSSWSVIQAGIPGVSPTTVYTGSTASVRSFMRVKVQ